MDRKVKLAASGGILFVGVAAAVLIGRPGRELSPSVPGRPDPLVLREVVGPQFPAGTLSPDESAISTPPPATPTAAAATPRATAAPRAPAPPRGPAELEPLPSMPETFADAAGDSGPAVLPPVEPASAGIRTHKVSDGDTLSALAQRYLGSANRYQEIFEANRDRLEDPELLPIGVRLRIPPRIASPVDEASPPSATAAVEDIASSPEQAAVRSPASPAVSEVATAPAGGSMPLADAAAGSLPPETPSAAPEPSGRLVPVIRTPSAGG